VMTVIEQRRREVLDQIDRLLGDLIKAAVVEERRHCLATIESFASNLKLDKQALADLRQALPEAHGGKRMILTRADGTSIEYGNDEEGAKLVHARICEAAKAHGQRLLARTAGVSREQLRTILKGEVEPRAKTIAKLVGAISVLALRDTVPEQRGLAGRI